MEKITILIDTSEIVLYNITKYTVQKRGLFYVSSRTDTLDPMRASGRKVGLGECPQRALSGERRDDTA